MLCLGNYIKLMNQFRKRPRTETSLLAASNSHRIQRTFALQETIPNLESSILINREAKVWTSLKIVVNTLAIAEDLEISQWSIHQLFKISYNQW